MFRLDKSKPRASLRSMKLSSVYVEVKFGWLAEPKVVIDALSKVFTRKDFSIRRDGVERNYSGFKVGKGRMPCKTPFHVKWYGTEGIIQAITSSRALADMLLEIILRAADGGFEILTQRFINHYKGCIPRVNLSDYQSLVKYMVENRIKGNVRERKTFKSGNPTPLRVTCDTTMILRWTPETHTMFGSDFGDVIRTVLLVTAGFRNLWLSKDILMMILLPMIAFQYQKKFLDVEILEKEVLDANTGVKWVRKRQEMSFHETGAVFGTCINPVIMNMIFYHVKNNFGSRSKS